MNKAYKAEGKRKGGYFKLSREKVVETLLVSVNLFKIYSPIGITDQQS
jgi:hypothetical protein